MSLCFKTNFINSDSSFVMRICYMDCH